VLPVSLNEVPEHICVPGVGVITGVTGIESTCTYIVAGGEVQPLTSLTVTEYTGGLE
jgi:hypothetical protein